MYDWCSEFQAAISNSNRSDIDSSMDSDIESNSGSDSEGAQLLEFLARAELDLAIFSTDESGDLASVDSQA
jgi:hypothetical protein